MEQQYTSVYNTSILEYIAVVYYFILCSEEVQGLPERLKKYKEGKHYLQATELLNNNGQCVPTLPHVNNVN